MKIQQISFSSTTQPTFKGIHVIDPNVQKLLLTGLKSEQLTELSKLIKDQQDNSVHIILGSKNGKQLNADLTCFYNLQDFKTKYKQKPFFESKFSFIKRVINAANEYKKQIQNFEVLPLKWDYSMLEEWAKKMYL